MYACDIAVFTIWCQAARQHFTGIDIPADLFVSHCNLQAKCFNLIVFCIIMENGGVYEK